MRDAERQPQCRHRMAMGPLCFFSTILGLDKGRQEGGLSKVKPRVGIFQLTVTFWFSFFLSFETGFHTIS